MKRQNTIGSELRAGEVIICRKCKKKIHQLQIQRTISRIYGAQIVEQHCIILVVKKTKKQSQK